MAQPLVSIGIPTYNRPERLARALRSAVSQTYERLEIIVSDNASPNPEVARIIAEAAAQDPRIVAHRAASNRGANANFSFVLSQASGDHFMWLGDDDEISPNYVATLSAALTADRMAMLAVGAVKGRHFRTGELNDNPQLAGLGTSPDLFTRMKSFLASPDSDGKATLLYGLHRRDDLYADLMRTCQGFAGNDVHLVYLRLMRGHAVRDPDAVFFLEWGDDKDYSAGDIGAFLRGLARTYGDMRREVAVADLTEDQKAELLAELALREAAWISGGSVETDGLKPSIDRFLAGTTAAAERRRPQRPRRPLFSVVVPTRNRPDTLVHTLRTIANQTYDDFEVIVCDNGTTDTAKPVVDAVHSDRFRYVRPDRSLSMTNNWNFAIDHVAGEHLVLFGDDDGLLPGALAELAKAHEDDDSAVLRWERLYYHWPDLFPPEDANQWRVFLTYGWQETPDGVEAIRNVLEGRWFYTRLPMLYNSSVRRDVIDRLRARTGRVFHGINPDITSGFTIALTAGRYRSLDASMSISGSSGTSNGALISKRGLESETSRDFVSLAKQDGVEWDSRSPRLLSLVGCVIDSWLTAQRVLGAEPGFELDRPALAGRLAAATVFHPAYRDSGQGFVLDELTRFLEDRTLAQKLIAAAVEAGEGQPEPWRQGFAPEVVDLNAGRFGVSDVAGAAALYGRVEEALRGLLRIGRTPEREQIVLNVLSRASSEPAALSPSRGMFRGLLGGRHGKDRGAMFSPGGTAALDSVNDLPPRRRLDGRPEFAVEAGRPLSVRGWAIDATRFDVAQLLFLAAVELASGTETLFLLSRQPRPDVAAKYERPGHFLFGFADDGLKNRLPRGSYELRFYQADLANVCVTDRENIVGRPLLVVT